MKNYIVLAALFMLTLLSGCKEEYIGQYPVDNVPPKSVSDVKIENLPGGANLTYVLPEEDDLLCITARYVLPSGGAKEMSSSAYSNKIELRGFGKGTKSTVEIVSVDKSYNESLPVRVEIEPLDSPIYDVFKTLKLYDSFGGVKLYWENPLRENVVFGAMVKNSDGEYKHVETIYSSEIIANRAIRGLDAKPTDFAFYFRDTYNNYTDTLYMQMNPIFEEELDKKKFVAMKLSPKFKFHSFGGGKMEAMWDNVYNVAANLCYIQPAAEPVYFNFDMGVEAKLSRFRLWSRRDYLFQLHHLRTFAVWGTNDVNATKDPDNWNGWYKIMECESKRPSGIETPGNLTTEDEEYATAGEEWEAPVDASKFRYMRIQVHTTWGNTMGGFINEITVWGSTK